MIYWCTIKIGCLMKMSIQRVQFFIHREQSISKSCFFPPVFLFLWLTHSSRSHFTDCIWHRLRYWWKLRTTWYMFLALRTIHFESLSTEMRMKSPTDIWQFKLVMGHLNKIIISPIFLSFHLHSKCYRFLTSTTQRIN